MQAAPRAGTPLCRLADLSDPGAKGFEFRDGEVFGYRDRCPHAGWPLALAPDRYLTREGDLILCAGHGALFRLDDGLGIGGPCAGQRLTAWPVEVAEGLVRTA